MRGIWAWLAHLYRCISFTKCILRKANLRLRFIRKPLLIDVHGRTQRPFSVSFRLRLWLPPGSVYSLLHLVYDYRGHVYCVNHQSSFSKAENQTQVSDWKSFFPAQHAGLQEEGPGSKGRSSEIQITGRSRRRRFHLWGQMHSRLSRSCYTSLPLPSSVVWPAQCVLLPKDFPETRRSYLRPTMWKSLLFKVVTHT